MSVLLAAAASSSSNSVLSHGHTVAACQNGNLWYVFWDGTANTAAIRLYYSTDSGGTWTNSSNVSFPGTGGGGDTQPAPGLFIDIDDYAHLIISDRNTANQILYYRGTPNAGRTAYTWSAAFTMTVSATYPGQHTGPIAHREGTGWKVHWLQTGTDQLDYRRINVTSAGVVTLDVTTTLGSGYATTGKVTASIDWYHTGDGKTQKAGNTPHLFVSWATGGTGVGKGIRFKKATYSAGAWTWGTEREIVNDVCAAPGNTSIWPTSTVFDGTRVYIGGIFTTTGSTYYYRLYERDVADTTTTLKTSDDNISSTLYIYGRVCASSITGDVYWFGGLDSAYNRAIGYRKWTRATNTLAATPTSLDDVAGDTSSRAAPTPWLVNNSYFPCAWATNASGPPWDMRYQTLSVNLPPNAPTLTGPADGAALDRGVANVFTWTFSDDNVGDTQSAFDLRYKITTDSIWTVVSQTTSTASWTAVANTFAAGNYEWQVRTTDNSGAVGPYTASRFFSAANAPATPTITAPTVVTGITAPNYTVTWTAAAHTAYQLRTVADAAGVPDTGNVYTDTGEVTDSSSTSRAGSFPVNGRVEHVQFRIKNSGVWSAWASNGPITVNYTLPSTPTIVLTANQSAATITVAITNPAGGQTVASNEVHVNDGLGGGYVRVATGIAVNGSYIYRTPRSGYEYNLKIFARAVGTNTATADSTHS